jgi:Cu-Zn family superoxide dismutase
MKKLLTALAVLSGTVLALTAWAQHNEKGAKEAMHGPTKAIAVLHPTAKSKVHGVITFTQKDGYVEVAGEVRELSPGMHGFHIHEFGDCSSADGSSAGGHFDPEGAPHGGPHDTKRHVGDLGNIKAGEDGVAKVMLKDKMLSLSGPHSIVGRSVIVHAKADDLKSQPSGDAGGRVACGVVGIAKAGAMKK